MERLDSVLARIDAAARRSGRDPLSVRLLLATKTRDGATIDAALAALVAAGRPPLLGENRAQEIAKHDAGAGVSRTYDGTAVERHFIGRIQTNKLKTIVPFADVVESVDRPELIAALVRRCNLIDRDLEVMLQVNTSGEETKGGFAPTSSALAVPVSQIAASGRLTLVGLMTIGSNTDDPEDARESLRRLAVLGEAVRDLEGGAECRELSMGMSGDVEVAVEEGATIVRIGSAVFGPREER